MSKRASTTNLRKRLNKNPTSPLTSRQRLFKLWLAALRREPGAPQALHRLLTSNPKIQATLSEFVEERNAKRRHAAPVSTQREATSWEKMAARGSGWVSSVSGGLPGLGKLR